MGKMTIEEAYKKKMVCRVKQLVLINKKNASAKDVSAMKILGSFARMYNKEILNMLNGTPFEEHLKSKTVRKLADR